ncbi:MAG: ABC transporter substrate-binding protein, partial [Microbacteriaceae bacterium]
HVFAGVDDLSKYSLEQHPESWVSGGSITLSEIIPGQRYSFVPNPYYPLRAAGNETITEFEFVIYPDLNAMQLALQSGNLDLAAPSLPPAAAKAIDGSHGVTVETVHDALNYSKLSFNASRDALSTAEVRYAIAGLIDTVALEEAVLQGYGKSLVGPVLPSYQPKYQPQITPIHSTVQQTKQTLADAGLSGLSLDLVCDSGNSNHVKYAGLIKELLSEAEISVNVNCMERSTSLARAKSGDFDLYIHKLGQAWSPGSNLVQQFHPSNPSGLYYNFVEDPELVTLLDAVDAQVEEGHYVTAVKAAAKYIHEQVYVLPLYVEALNSAYSSKRFAGFVPTGMETSTMLNPFSLAQVVPQ